eukprot:SAG22_NODE_1136_length_5395_cov_2.101189_5_plen_92_part_00
MRNHLAVLKIFETVVDVRERRRLIRLFMSMLSPDNWKRFEAVRMHRWIHRNKWVDSLLTPAQRDLYFASDKSRGKDRGVARAVLCASAAHF